MSDQFNNLSLLGRQAPRMSSNCLCELPQTGTPAGGLLYIEETFNNVLPEAVIKAVDRT